MRQPPARKRMNAVKVSPQKTWARGEGRGKSPSSFPVARSRMKTQGPGPFSYGPCGGAVLNLDHRHLVQNWPSGAGKHSHVTH